MGEDLAIKGKKKAITLFFQVKPKPPKLLPKRKRGRPWKTPPPQLSPSNREKSQQSLNIAVFNEQKAKVYDKLVEDVGKGIEHIVDCPRPSLRNC